MADAVEIRHYIDRAGRDVFLDWLSKLADDRSRSKIAARVNRLSTGNFGDSRPLGHGLHELRVNWGPGYRVYYTSIGMRCVLLLCAGDKRSQASDIARARAYLEDYETAGENP
jgi:putative addiction module killer protein